MLSLALIVGFAAGRWLVPEHRALAAELATVHAEVRAQQAAADRLGRQSRQDRNAYAVRLAELQAASTRLDALGERIVQLAELSPEEFDFSSPVALGGPENPLDTAGADDALESGLTALRSRLRHQSAALDALQAILLDRELREARTPSRWPLRGGWVSSGFGERTDPFSGRPSRHEGVDIAGPRGSEVLSVADGVVIWAGDKAGYGRTVEIDHGNGYVTRYAHNAEISVTVGQAVHGGQPIGIMGRSGRASAPHVHFEVLRNGTPVNPSAFLSAAP